MKKTLYVDMDNVLVDFRSAIPLVSEEILQQYEGRPDEIPGIFGLMNPMPHAIESYCELAEIFDTYILSTAAWENPSAWSDKLQWVKRYLGQAAYKRLILSHHKDLNVGHFLVDDRTDNGACEFKGEFIHFGTERYPDWPSVVRYLQERAK